MVTAKIIDEDGIEYTINNAEVFVMQMENTLLVRTYKSTIYWHEVILESEKAVEEGVLQLENAEAQSEYQPQLVENAIRLMREQVLERWGVETHDRIIKEINFNL